MGVARRRTEAKMLCGERCRHTAPGRHRFRCHRRTLAPRNRQIACGASGSRRGPRHISETVSVAVSRVRGGPPETSLASHRCTKADSSGRVASAAKGIRARAMASGASPVFARRSGPLARPRRTEAACRSRGPSNREAHPVSGEPVSKHSVVRRRTGPHANRADCFCYSIPAKKTNEVTMLSPQMRQDLGRLFAVESLAARDPSEANRLSAISATLYEPPPIKWPSPPPQPPSPPPPRPPSPCGPCK